MKQNLTVLVPIATSVLVWATLGSIQSADANEKIYKQTVRGTVLIPTGRGHASGVLIDKKNRLVVTAQHVTDARSRMQVIFPLFNKDGRVIVNQVLYGIVRKGDPNEAFALSMRRRLAIPAKVLYADAWRDVSILQIDRVPPGAEEVPLALDSARPGQNIHMVGCAGGRDGGVFGYCQGKVRNVFFRSFPGMTHYKTRVLEAQLATNKGDSGGPIVNDKGELVAVVSQGTIGAATRGIFFAKQIVDHDSDVSEIRTALALSKAVVYSSSGRLTRSTRNDSVFNTPARSHVFAMQPGYKYIIDLHSSDFDTYLRLDDAQKKELARNDDRGDGTHSRITFAPAKQETCRIIAAAFFGGGGKKRFDANMRKQNYVEYGLQILRFAKAPQVQIIKGNLENTDARDPVLGGLRHDGHNVQMKAGCIYVIDMKSAWDPLLRLEGPDGFNLAVNDDVKRGNLNSRIEFTCGRTGNYRIVASSFRTTATGPYVISVQEYRPAGSNN